MSIASEPLSFRITSLIHFPPSWRLASGPHINPHAEQVEKDVFTWLDKHGLIPTEALKQRVGMMQVSGYAGMMQPLSSYSHCLAIAAFLTLWLLWDDVVVEKLGKEQTQDHTEQFIAIMVGKPAWNPENIPFRTPEMTEETHTIQITRHRYLCAWYDLMNNYIIDVDSSFRQRLGAVMKEWMIVGLEESELYYQWTHRDLKASYEATPSQQAEPQQPQAQPQTQSQTQPQTQSQTPAPAPTTAVTPTPTVDAPVASSAGTQSYVSKSLSALPTTKTRPTLTRQVSCISSKPIIIRQASLNRPNLMREPSHSKMVVQRLPSYKHKHVQPQASTTASTSTSALSIDARMINFPALEHRRRVSIGMIPTVQLLEWTLGLKQSLPTSILQNELFLEMIALSCKSVYILNELVSLGKDHAQGWPNLCEIWKNIQHTTIHDSIQDFVAQHVDVIERFDECECELLQQIDTQWQEAVKQHAQRIRYACYGFVQCKRYMRKLRTEDGVTYWFAVDVSA